MSDVCAGLVLGRRACEGSKVGWAVQGGRGELPRSIAMVSPEFNERRWNVAQQIHKELQAQAVASHPTTRDNRSLSTVRAGTCLDVSTDTHTVVHSMPS